MRAALILLTLLTATAAHAQYDNALTSERPKPEWRFGLGLGPNLSKVDAVSDDLGSSVGGTLYITRNWGEMHRLDVVFDYFDFTGDGQNYPGLSVAYGLRVFNELYFKPFALIGAGVGKANNFPFTVNRSQTSPHIFARVGADRIWENERKSIRVGLIFDFLHVDLDDNKATSAQLGLPMVTLTFPFGGDEEKPAPPPSPAPAPVAKYDPDSDGDGVRDSRDECPNTPQGTKVNSIGCPPKKVVKKALRVEFETAKDVILPDYYHVVDEFAEWMKTNADLKVRIEGHTDSVGKRAYNLKLSDARAASVRRALIERGVPADRITSKGFGPDQPEASNKTVEGRSRNRRVIAAVQSK